MTGDPRGADNSVRVRLELFALARDRAGRQSLDMALACGTTVGQFRRELSHRLPELASILPHCMFAMDDEYAANDCIVRHGAVLACIPPVSGG